MTRTLGKINSGQIRTTEPYERELLSGAIRKVVGNAFTSGHFLTSEAHQLPKLIWGFRSNKHTIADEQNCTGEKRGSAAEQLFAASPGEHQQRHDYCE